MLPSGSWKKAIHSSSPAAPNWPLSSRKTRWGAATNSTPRAAAWCTRSRCPRRRDRGPTRWAPFSSSSRRCRGRSNAPAGWVELGDERETEHVLVERTARSRSVARWPTWCRPWRRTGHGHRRTSRRRAARRLVASGPCRRPLPDRTTAATSARPSARSRPCGWSGSSGQRATRSSVGIDEVGRGAWAGRSRWPRWSRPPEHLRGVRDSKQLDPPEREKAARRGAQLGRRASASATRRTSECDELGMTAALRVAGHARARASSTRRVHEPDRIVLDGNHDYLRMPVQGHHRDQGRHQRAWRSRRRRASPR